MRAEDAGSPASVPPAVPLPELTFRWVTPPSIWRRLRLEAVEAAEEAGSSRYEILPVCQFVQ